ncbi:MAG TPA: hypothetical protein VF748_08590 [Candidatus Acidoferrum sp.]
MDPGRLSVSALSLALPMERHGDDDISGESASLASHYLSKSLGKPRARGSS